MSKRIRLSKLIKEADSISKTLTGEPLHTVLSDAVDRVVGRLSQPTEQFVELTCWEWLGLNEGASLDEVKSAYRNMMQAVHPDTGGKLEPWQMAKINKAYQEACVLAKNSEHQEEKHGDK